MILKSKTYFIISILCFITWQLKAQSLDGFAMNPSPGCSDGIIYTWIYSGIPPYTFQWSNGLSNSYQTGLAAGNYCVTVTDATCCQSIRCFQLHDEGVIEVTGSRNPMGDGFCDGSIDVTATGAGAPFTFEWSNGASTEDIENLCVGRYTVTITSQKGCSKILTVMLDQSCYDDPASPNRYPAPFSIQPDITSVSNGSSNDGAIRLNVQGGAPPYYFNWSGPNQFSARESHIQNLGIGTYCVKSTDGCGQSYSQCFTINNCNSAAPMNIALNTDGKSCKSTILTNLPGTTITATPRGGTPPFRFLWSTGSVLNPLRQASYGIHYITVTDSRNCKAYAEVEVANGYSEQREKCFVTAFCEGHYVGSFVDPAEGSLSTEALASKCQLIIKCRTGQEVIIQGNRRILTDPIRCLRLTGCEFILGGQRFFEPVQLEDLIRTSTRLVTVPPPPNCIECLETKVCIQTTFCELTGQIIEQRQVDPRKCGLPGIRRNNTELISMLPPELEGLKLIRTLAELDSMFRIIGRIKIDAENGITLQKAETIPITQKELYQIYPNPFEDEVHLKYELEEDGVVEVAILNSSGQMVSSRAFESLKGGNKQVIVLGNHFPIGIYLVQLKDKNKVLYSAKILKL